MNHKPIETTQASSVERVRFTDGMIVTAEDLHDAMSYPLDVFRMLVRAFFGCGIVCGLEVRKCTNVKDQCKEQAPKGGPQHAVCVAPGAAVDCHGYPIELCRPVILDFSGQDCGKPYDAYIAIRRLVSEECPRPTDLCSSGVKEAAYECTRLREQAQVRAFLVMDGKDERPPSLCQFAEASEGKPEKDPCAQKEEMVEPDDEESPECTCLKACEDPLCCEEAWVFLACYKVDKQGTGEVDWDGRKYVKPIDCVCRDERAVFRMSADWREKVVGNMASKKVSMRRPSPRQK